MFTFTLLNFTVSTCFDCHCDTSKDGIYRSKCSSCITDLVDGWETVENAEHQTRVAVHVARDLDVESIHQHLIQRVRAYGLRHLTQKLLQHACITPTHWLQRVF